MKPKDLHVLRALVKSELGADDARIEQWIKIGRRNNLAGDLDSLSSIWLAVHDPSWYGGSRGPQPADKIKRALEIEGDRQSARSVDWDPSTPGAIEAAELLAAAMSTSSSRGRRRGTRPQSDRRAAARARRAIVGGQASFAGIGWGAG